MAMNQDVLAPYYGELGRPSFSPGWARPEPSMWPVPRPKFKPAVWRFAAARTALERAGEFVPMEQAERRNLIMVNPIAGNIYATSRNIVSAYQMVKAGEKARSHRHANESDATSYWIDFLDVPFVQHSEAMFFEPNPAGFETVTSTGPSPYRIPARD